MALEAGGLRVGGVALAPGAAPPDDVVGQGEFVGLAGLDGQGQEAFLEILAGLRAPAAGRVVVARPDGGGDPITGFRQAVRRGGPPSARRLPAPRPSSPPLALPHFPTVVPVP